MIIRENVRVGDKTITLETGRIAKQAQGAVLVTCGETMVLVTVCGTQEPRPGIDFFPLSVDYVEKTYAAGRIPGGFFKREGRLRDDEILVSRLIDVSTHATTVFLCTSSPQHRSCTVCIPTTFCRELMVAGWRPLSQRHSPASFCPDGSATSLRCLPVAGSR